jgi:hypothetical protein
VSEPTPLDFARGFISKQWCQHNIRQSQCSKCLAGLLKSYGRAQAQPLEAKLAELLSLVDSNDPEISRFLKKHNLTKAPK